MWKVLYAEFEMLFQDVETRIWILVCKILPCSAAVHPHGIAVCMWGGVKCKATTSFSGNHEKKICVCTSTWNGMVMFMWTYFAVFESNVLFLKYDHISSWPFFPSRLYSVLLTALPDWNDLYWVINYVRLPELLGKLHPQRLCFLGEYSSEKCENIGMAGFLLLGWRAVL